MDQPVTRGQLIDIMKEHSKDDFEEFRRLLAEHHKLVKVEIEGSVEKSAHNTTEQIAKLWANGPISKIQSDISSLRESIESRPCLLEPENFCNFNQGDRNTIENADRLMDWLGKWPKWLPAVLILIGVGLGSGLMEVGSGLMKVGSLLSKIPWPF